jgi:hypothetical protein
MNPDYLMELSPASKALAASRIRAETEASALTNGPDIAMQAGLRQADKLEQSAGKPFPTDPTEVCAGGELAPHTSPWKISMACVNTVTAPTYITAEASRARLELADQARVLDLTLDLSDTIQAGNSAERMLAAQMAALHKVAMKTAARALETDERLAGYVQNKDREILSIQLQRLTNSMVRASAGFQEGMLTLQRSRNGGKQAITVTHIQNTQVNEGGKAVVTSGPVAGGVGVLEAGRTNGK